MDRPLLVTLGAVMLAAVVASAGTYVLVGRQVPDTPPATTVPPTAPPPPSPPPTTSPNVTTEPETWVFVLEGTRPPPPDQSGVPGTVVALLTKVRGDRNLSASNGSVTVEVAAVNWTAFSLQPPPNGTILGALNARFAATPPVSLVRAALSRHGDGAELTVPLGRGVASVVVHAPATGEFLIVDWPSGGVYGWSEEARQWGALPSDRPATLLARPEG